MTEATEQSTEEQKLDSLWTGVKELYSFRNFYFEQSPRPPAADRQRLLRVHRDQLLENFNQLDEDKLSGEHRARLLYMKGRTYNVVNEYDARATQALNKAVKLNPRLAEAWNELGESYWKNFNTKEAKSSFEGALKTARTKVTLRSLSIILRQEVTNDLTTPLAERKKLIQHTVELAKEAVALDIKDGVSWCVLGNSYLCLFFVVTQNLEILKQCMSAYKQAESDPIARGQPDLHYNKGMAYKYCEQYSSAMECFTRAMELDPTWEPPAAEQTKLNTFLTSLTELIRTRGKIKSKKLLTMAKSIDKKMLGQYGEPDYQFSSKNLKLTLCRLDELSPGPNRDRVVLGKVVGSIHSERVVPFTFALMDAHQTCVGVTVYNWADGRGVIIGDTVAVPSPLLNVYNVRTGQTDFEFRSIRIDNPVQLMVNGKRISQNQLASTRISCKYQLQ